MNSELSKIGIYDLDHRSGRYTCSESVFECFGVEPIDFDCREQTLFSNVHAEDRLGLALAMAAARKSGDTSRFQFRVMRPDGSIREIEASEQTFFDTAGQAIRTHGVYRDIECPDIGEEPHLHINRRVERFDANRSDEVLEIREALRIEAARRKAAEAALAQCEARLRVVFDQASQYCVLLSIDGIYIEINQSALNIRGKRREDLIGRHFWDIPDSLFDQRTCTLMIDMLEEAILGRVARRLIEIQRGNSRWLVFDLTMKPILAEDGRVGMILCEARDVGELCRAQFEAKVAKEEAEKKSLELERQAVELARARDQALASVRTRTDFLANVSHEIRSPMTAILGSAEILLDTSLKPAEQEFHIIAIRRNGEHLLNIINDILDLSKIEADKLELELQSYSPWQLMHEVVSSLQVRADERRVRLQVSPLGSLPPAMMMDPTRLRQIILNLGGNAIKFSKPGDLVSIRMGATKQGEDNTTLLQLEVEDHGIGIHPDHLEKIFQPFEQADSSMSRRFGGTGLGLSIVQRLVQAMHGTIQVSSELEKGSLFRVEIPYSNSEFAENWVQADNLKVTPTKEKRPQGFPTLKLQARVLLAEDHVDNQRILVYHLKRGGLTVEVAQNGLEAVEKAMHGSFDLILMDMQMPALDGYGAVRVLRRSGYQGKIIALTAHAMLEDRGRCLEVGCDDYLSKPVDPHRLISKIDEVLRQPRTNSGDHVFES